MHIPINWLGEYVELPQGVTGEQVAADLVRVGFEEESLGAQMITGPLVVGKVLSREPEPQKNGKVINWCQVDVGQANGTGEPQGIICGAHNFDVDDLVVVSLPGAVLSGGFEISERKTYGHLSAGMICSAAEPSPCTPAGMIPSATGATTPSSSRRAAVRFLRKRWSVKVWSAFTPSPPTCPMARR